MRRRLPLPTILFLPLFLGACGDDGVTAYRVPKETVSNLTPPSAVRTSDPIATPTADGSGAMATAVATAQGPALTWTAPAKWQARTGSAMRKATFAIEGKSGASAELAITAFPGDVGGEMANVNRWRGQIQLPPWGEAEIAANVTRLEAGDLKIAVVDLGAPGSSMRMLGAIVPFGDATWFFKLLGPDATVATEKPVFLEFLATLRSAAALSTP